jgi:hypothetical protein
VCLESLFGLVRYSERLPFISQGGVYMAIGTPTCEPNDAVQDNVLFIIMASQAKEIPLLDSIACSRNPPSGMSRRCLVGVAPGIASGVTCHVAERAA